MLQERLELRRPEARAEGNEVARFLQRARFGRVDCAAFELVGAPRVVHVGMRDHDGEGPVEEISRCLLEARQSHAGVDQEVSIASADVPDVAPEKRVDVRFDQVGDCVIDP